MNAKNFKNYLQKEISTEGFLNKIENISWIGAHTLITFKTSIKDDYKLIAWLYNRFTYGITLTQDERIISINTSKWCPLKTENKELSGAKIQLKKEIMEAYLFLREKNTSIPSETLDFIKDAAIEKANNL
jgi:hypothetical protein